MALYVACHRGHYDTVRYLLEQGNLGRKHGTLESQGDSVSVFLDPSSADSLDLSPVTHRAGSMPGLCGCLGLSQARPGRGCVGPVWKVLSRLQ